MRDRSVPLTTEGITRDNRCDARTPDERLGLAPGLEEPPAAARLSNHPDTNTIGTAPGGDPGLRAS